MHKTFHTYILTNKPYGTLYIGVTSNLIKRIWQHKESLHNGFTKKYQLTNLVYYETHDNAENAIVREKQLKKWKRQWKLNLIEQFNPSWSDLYRALL
jgi:putative endonuclease